MVLQQSSSRLLKEKAFEVIVEGNTPTHILTTYLAPWCAYTPRRHALPTPCLRYRPFNTQTHHSMHHHQVTHWRTPRCDKDEAGSPHKCLEMRVRPPAKKLGCSGRVDKDKCTGLAYLA